jgi:hypothetical protein
LGHWLKEWVEYLMCLGILNKNYVVAMGIQVLWLDHGIISVVVHKHMETEDIVCLLVTIS